jgi:hypothetical protein
MANRLQPGFVTRRGGRAGSAEVASCSAAVVPVNVPVVVPVVVPYR